MSNGCYEVPTNWTLVAFAGNQTTSCPQGASATDVYESPSAGAGACACGCQVSAAPTCPPGVAVHYDNNGGKMCGSTGIPATMSAASACNTDMYTGNFPGLGYESLQLQYTPNPSTGGACASAASPDSSAITYGAQDRVCQPATEPCTGAECTPSFGAGFGVCIEASGMQTCPGTTFTVQHVVGGAASFTCTAGCSCTVSAACTGVVKLYTVAGCNMTNPMGTELDIPANNTCVDSGATSNTYASYAYAPDPVVATCTPGGTSTAQNVALTGVQTICCAP